VYEHVLAVLAADETITFGVVEPLYCSCFHGVALFLCIDMALKFAGLSAGSSRTRRELLIAGYR
jgi:hypothetical protein